MEKEELNKFYRTIKNGELFFEKYGIRNSNLRLKGEGWRTDKVSYSENIGEFIDLQE